MSVLRIGSEILFRLKHVQSEYVLNKGTIRGITPDKSLLKVKCAENDKVNLYFMDEIIIIKHNEKPFHAVSNEELKSSDKENTTDIRLCSEEVIVFGFVRIHQSLLPYKKNVFYNIPLAITNIILIFYMSGEEWNTNKKGANISISENGKVIKSTSKCDAENVFGTMLCENGYHLWKFKIITMATNHYAIRFGLENESFFQKRDKHTKDYDSAITYSWVVSSQKPYLQPKAISYGQQAMDTDIIEMIFDGNKNTLSYHLNDKDLGIAFEDISKDAKWRMAVTIYKYPNEIELLQYQKLIGS